MDAPARGVAVPESLVGFVQSNLEAAQRFFDAAEATFESLARTPELSKRRHYRSPRAAGSRAHHAESQRPSRILRAEQRSHR